MGDISYYDYQGISCDEEEKKDIAECLGPVNKAMIMRNHGLIALGKTVEESYQILFNLMTACETQVSSEDYMQYAYVNTNMYT